MDDKAASARPMSDLAATSSRLLCACQPLGSGQAAGPQNSQHIEVLQIIRIRGQQVNGAVIDADFIAR
jgi:hypothetical protein